MTTTTIQRPETIRLADALKRRTPFLDGSSTIDHAEKELRRQHAEIARLTAENEALREAAVQGGALLFRAEELHKKAFMPWDEAEMLALSEFGITDLDIQGLIDEHASSILRDCMLGLDDLEDYTRALLVHGIALLQCRTSQHADDVAVDAFAEAMKAKMARQRANGYGGWQECPADDLRRMLSEHVAKGDPVDVGNFAMMLFNRWERT